MCTTSTATLVINHRLHNSNLMDPLVPNHCGDIVCNNVVSQVSLVLPSAPSLSLNSTLSLSSYLPLFPPSSNISLTPFHPSQTSFPCPSAYHSPPRTNPLNFSLPYSHFLSSSPSLTLFPVSLSHRQTIP
ncbi:hypothetical protein J6590_094026 [Homalodisca vitripennis]|nr:hypothetical protein J6590_094026 [Homalodisca vitripennis]